MSALVCTIEIYYNANQNHILYYNQVNMIDNIQKLLPRWQRVRDGFGRSQLVIDLINYERQQFELKVLRCISFEIRV